MRIIIILVSVFFSVQLSAQNSIYTFKLDSISGSNQIDFAAFQGKRILVVNTASMDSLSSQFNELIQLKKFFRDSLVIIAVPSNSFNSEPSVDSSIVAFYQQSSVYRIPVSRKAIVTGGNICALYHWLTSAAQNGVMDSEVKGSFQKYLINASGKLIGVFTAAVRPMDENLIHAIVEGFQ